MKFQSGRSLLTSPLEELVLVGSFGLLGLNRLPAGVLFALVLLLLLPEHLPNLLGHQTELDDHLVLHQSEAQGERCHAEQHVQRCSEPLVLTPRSAGSTVGKSRHDVPKANGGYGYEAVV